MNLVLIGYRCSGKTSVGELLAGRLGLDFVDLDRLLEEEAGRPIQDLVAAEGWDGFRAREGRLIAAACRRGGIVIATGGGAVTRGENVANLKRSGFVVWLKGNAEVLRSRMAGEERSGRVRPALSGPDPLTEIEEVLAARNPLYQGAADLVVDTTARSLDEVAEQILRNLPPGFSV
ncbi:MAG TPA: shikimate kinase [Syntrophobacteria bacterium]|nr:shikimate kinase [Syntrophobacteria bacterium]